MKCTICKKRFTPQKADTYLVRCTSDTYRKDDRLFARIRYNQYIDCSRCGLQILMGERKTDEVMREE